jgi:hypothetical protein
MMKACIADDNGWWHLARSRKFAEAFDEHSQAPQMVDNSLFVAPGRKPQDKVESRMLSRDLQFVAEGLAQLSQQQIPSPHILIS